ncbi:MAG: hypothetical protein R3F49_03960 [Planctomycetota bacterium]
MTQTAKRRWSRELDSQIDGIAFGTTGPVLLHGYDPPAGGKWLDDVIPGKLGAFDRHTGERLWLAPCEVGYGRGFGAGIGPHGNVLVLGPSAGGHMLVRMSVSDGELIEAASIDTFDEAFVGPDRVICVSARHIVAYDGDNLQQRWSYARDGERYHAAARHGRHLFVAVSTSASRGYGLHRIDALTGRYDGTILPLGVPMIRDVAATAGGVVVLTSDLERVLPAESTSDYMRALAAHPAGGPRDTLSLVALRHDAEPGDQPSWFKILETEPVDSVPDVSISGDSGKLYVERLAYLEAIDVVSGRQLGNWTVPGLDEQVAWGVVEGAGLLAEETRVSVFELPA